MPSIGPMELIVVLVIALLVLGPKRLPEAGRSVGRGLREFRGALTDDAGKQEAAAGLDQAAADAQAANTR